jgi:hypothetical protein
MPARRLAAATHALVLHLRDLQSQSVAAGEPLQLVMEPNGYKTPSAHIAWSGIEASLVPAAIITMYPDGSSSGGEFELRSDSHRAVVTVSALNGRVRQSP